MIDNFFIWDKKSPINGSNADIVLNSNEKFRDNTVVFFTNKGIPVVHDFVESLRLKYNMNEESDEIVCKTRLNEIMNQQNSEHQEQLNLQEQIEKLKQENASINYILMQNNLL